MIRDFFKRFRIVISEAFSSFMRNNDLTAASSLAFSATLALIPTLFLLTFLVSAVIGSSERALAKTQELLNLVIPAYSQDILHEVGAITAHLGTIGLLNGLILLWSITPLVADLRTSLGTIFRKRPSRPFLLEKLFDVAIGLLFLTALAAISAAGVVFTFLQKKGLVHMPRGFIEDLVPFFLIGGTVFLLYFAFSSRARVRDLLIGSLVTSLLWSAMTPAFHLFLTYNPGYGFAFGSFKSLFVVIIWIYYSLVVFLCGAEIAASLGRGETVFIKKLMEGKKNVPMGIIKKYVVSYEKGSFIFNEGDAGNEMYGVLKGKVLISKGEKEIGTIPEGKCFGAMAFLLSTPRMAAARALEDVELVTISNENIDTMMNEYPEFFIQILKEIALRLREANKTVD